MDECKCPKEKDLAIFFATINRWTPIMEGNGHEAIGTRLKTIEDKQTRDYKAMENLLQSSEDLKTVVSALSQTVNFDRKQREMEAKKQAEEERKKKSVFDKVNAKWILFAMFIALLYQIFHDIFL